MFIKWLDRKKMFIKWRLHFFLNYKRKDREKCRGEKRRGNTSYSHYWLLLHLMNVLTALPFTGTIINVLIILCIIFHLNNYFYFTWWTFLTCFSLSLSLMLISSFTASLSSPQWLGWCLVNFPSLQYVCFFTCSLPLCYRLRSLH